MSKRKRSSSKRRSSASPPSRPDGDNTAAAPAPTLKRKRSKKQNSGRQQLPDGTVASAQKQPAASTPQSVGTSNYPYPTDYNDHFETPLRAYTDILPLMQAAINKRNHSKGHSSHETSNEITIYDPYFCTGRAASLLDQTFREHSTKKQTRVCIKHEKRDFYKDIRKNRIPRHDLLVTNPPYSGNHKERCLEFAVGQLKSNGIPFFLLMPNYVASKEYFRKVVLEENIQNVFVAPPSNQPYEYDHPEGTGHETPPFQSVWFCGLSYGKYTESEMTSMKDGFTKFHKSNHKRVVSCSVPRIATGLQEFIHLGCVSGEKRKNPRQRKKMRQLAMQRANQPK